MTTPAEIARMQSEVDAFKRYEASIQRPQQPAPAANASQGHFRSQYELVTAMSDLRYKEDPAFRAEVVAWMAGNESRGIPIVSHVNSDPGSALVQIVD